MMSKELIRLAIKHMKASQAYEQESMSDTALWNTVCFNHDDTADYNFTIIEKGGKHDYDEKFYVVVSVNIPDYCNVLLRIDGVYDSWGDDSFQEKPYLVQPVEVTKIEYQRIV